MKLDKNKTMLIIAGIGIILVLIFMNKILSALGIRKSKAKLQKEEAETELRAADYFNPTFHKTVVHKKLGEGTAKAYAKELNNAWKFLRKTFAVNVEAVLSVFSKLMNKAQISEIAEQYYIDRKEDLRGRIMRELNDKQQLELFNIIKNLPDV